MSFSGKDNEGVTSAMIQQALSQIPPTGSSGTKHNSLRPNSRDVPSPRTFSTATKALLTGSASVDDGVNEEPDIAYAFPTHPDPLKYTRTQPNYEKPVDRGREALHVFSKANYAGSFTSSDDQRSPKSDAEYTEEINGSRFYDSTKVKVSSQTQNQAHTLNTYIGEDTRPKGRAEMTVNQKEIISKLYNSVNATSLSSGIQEKERKGLQRGAGVRRKKRARVSGGGARAVRVPEDKDFVPGLSGPLTTLLRKGGRELNPLQMQKLIDATTALQQMQVHILEPLTLYTAAELYDLMASMTETWKNSGKAAWKKRINKIRENSRGRKPPRNKLDEGEIAEILQLEKQIQEREEWEKLEKEKLQLRREKNTRTESNKRKKKDTSGSKQSRGKKLHGDSDETRRSKKRVHQ